MDLVAEEVKRAIGRQEANLDGLRTRSLGLLSTSGIIAALFSPRTLNHSLNIWQTAALVVALLAFSGGVFTSIMIQKPADFKFSLDLDAWFVGSEPPQDPIASNVGYGIPKALWAAHQENNAKIAAKTKFLTCTCFAVLIQVVAWSLSLI